MSGCVVMAGVSTFFRLFSLVRGSRWDDRGALIGRHPREPSSGAGFLRLSSHDPRDGGLTAIG